MKLWGGGGRRGGTGVLLPIATPAAASWTSGMHPEAVVTPRGAEDKGHLEAVVLQWSGTQVQTQWLAFALH